MRRLALLALLLVVPAAAAAARATAPTVRVVSTAPVRVAGHGFKPHERVKLTAATDAGTVRRSILAGPAGGFTVTLVGVTSDPCSSSLEIVAAGATGDRAVVKTVPRECPPAP